MRRTLTLALLLLASSSFAEVRPWSPGVPGLVKADVDTLLVEDGVPISDAAVTLVEIGSDGDYEWRGLPDTAAGSSTRYWFRTSYLGESEVYSWPLATRTPQAVVNAVTVRPVPDRINIGAGDTAIQPQAIVAGLAADPTGSDVTFTMRRVAGGAPVVDAEPAVLADVDQVVDPITSEVTWTATVVYTFEAADTSTAGDYRGWFVITFPDGGTMTAPPQKNIAIKIH